MLNESDIIFLKIKSFQRMEPNRFRMDETKGILNNGTQLAENRIISTNV